jgi:hypothetical protein
MAGSLSIARVILGSHGGNEAVSLFKNLEDSLLF